MNVQHKEQNETRIIQSKFGAIEVNPENAIYFPYGILGFADQTSYCLIPCPVEKFKDFLLLQAMDDDELIFMVKPINHQAPDLIKIDDLKEAYELVGVNEEDVAVVLIASAKETESGKRITVNCRAPVFIDINNKAAMQFVLQNTDYDVQHLI